MAGIKTTVSKDTARPALRRILASVNPKRPLFAALAGRLTTVLKSHFVEKETQPNKRGWPSGHLWSKVRSLTGIRSVTETEAVVGIADPRFGMRYRGGTIRPKEKQYLAVPLSAEAARAGYPSANLIPGVFMITSKKGSLLLVKREGKTLSLLWALKKSVPHPKDPTALPTDAAINAALIKEAGLYIERHAQ